MSACPVGALSQTPAVISRRTGGSLTLFAATGSTTVVYPAVSLLAVGETMASSAAKQGPKIVSKTSAGGGGAAGVGGGPPIMPLASPLMGKKKKPFLGMPAPLGYVPGLGRG